MSNDQKWIILYFLSTDAKNIYWFRKAVELAVGMEKMIFEEHVG